MNEFNTLKCTVGLVFIVNGALQDKIYACIMYMYACRACACMYLALLSIFTGAFNGP